MGDTATTTEKSHSTSSKKYPEWASTAGQDIFGKASTYTDENPYKEYAGPTMAEFGPGWKTALDAIMQKVGTGGSNAALPMASTMFASLQDQIGADLAQNTVPNLMGSYVDATLNPIRRDIAQKQGEANATLGAGAATAGAMGDTGMALERNKINQTATNAMADATAGVYDRAFNSASSRFDAMRKSNLDKLFQIAGAQTGIASEANNQQTKWASLLSQLGGGEQAAGQTGINTAINVNDKNQAGRLGQWSKLAAILSGIPLDTVTETEGESTKESPDNGWMSLLGTLGGALIGKI